MNKMPRVSLVCVGTELLYNNINTNVFSIEELLSRSGLSLSCNLVVPDNIEEIKLALMFCSQHYDIIIISGGLGPTFDDVTREALSQFTGRPLIFSDEIWKHIEERFAARHIAPPEGNRKQALVIEGAVSIPNEYGTAPGMHIEYKGKHFFLLPGPPKELIPMMEKYVLACLNEIIGASGEATMRVCFSIAGEPESAVAQRTQALREKLSSQGAQWTILAKPYAVQLWMRIPASCRTEFENTVSAALQDEFGLSYLGTGDASLPEILGRLLVSRKLKLAVAESCTGGLAGHIITSVPGSSEYFNGSFVVYSNILKRKILRVPRPTLKKYGAVSAEAVTEMARGARKYGKADCGLAISGIAGPGGATGEKPVGLVWVAATLPDKKTMARQFLFSGDRDVIKTRAAYTAIDFLRRCLLGEKK